MGILWAHTGAIGCIGLMWAMLSVMSFEVGTSYSAQSVLYMEGNALCCCKDSANLCSKNLSYSVITCDLEQSRFLSAVYIQ